MNDVSVNYLLVYYIHYKVISINYTSKRFNYIYYADKLFAAFAYAS